MLQSIAPPPTKRRFTVAEYYRMADAGILADGERVELIDGEIIQMSPIGDRHGGCVRRGNWFLQRAVGDSAMVSVQSPVRLDTRSEPEPDIALLRWRDDFYSSGHPTPADVLLLVEIADSSRAYDRQIKVPLYARFGIPEVWLAELGPDTVTAYRDPTPDGYRTIQVARRGQRLPIPGFPGLEIAVSDLLG